ncbi:TetR/AcrR family transcriptional regulator [Amorphus orientalis]|uniref:AcrR family transcriptional regulator n=1 Tax=Amorphus orientalis TaxID=649198 RepID=A0AAE4ARM9_9HYPH|nr:TetR/AcrR family transcriptional regulator [Amorphus orientalis]MDQ0314025.1 AcrR family transcriptional regulator [Amorphus orientalis]
MPKHQPAGGEHGAARTARPAPRIVPTQKRSRERMERILNAAVELISEAGSDAMKMSALAERSGISIGSLYQYFPDKSAILGALAERYHAESRACIAEKLDPVDTPAAFEDAFDGLIEIYYQLFLEDPAIRDVWSGTQADKALADVDLLNCWENGDLLADTLARIGKREADPELRASAFTVMSLGEAAMRLAIAGSADEGRRVVDAYKRMALCELKRALGDIDSENV